MRGSRPAIKDRLIFLGWVAGLIIAASLLWSFTAHFRNVFLMQSVNKIFFRMEDPRRLETPLPRPSSEPVPLGFWYKFAQTDSLFYIFTIMKDGILIPCGAEINGEGIVSDIVPLGNHAGQLISRVPQGQIQLYTRRIEAAVAAGVKAK